ncbi:MAG: hypothetical protein M1831_007461 [Alyxoria varia]|nr:MAG: hypothetical protein M1831_007461 [Alyxoria varia]
MSHLAARHVPSTLTSFHSQAAVRAAVRAADLVDSLASPPQAEVPAADLVDSLASQAPDLEVAAAQQMTYKVEHAKVQIRERLIVGLEHGRLTFESDVTFIFARGTSEPGNVGSVVGPPLINALKQQIGADRVAAQGVNYPASTSGNFPGSNNPGPKNMADFASQAATKCPNTQIVLGGYSQGATVTHNAVSQLAANVVSKVKAITVFGDPLNGQAFKGVPTSNVKNYCASGDSVCRTPTGTGGNGHLSYGGNANDAATFIKGRIQ